MNLSKLLFPSLHKQITTLHHDIAKHKITIANLQLNIEQASQKSFSDVKAQIHAAKIQSASEIQSAKSSHQQIFNELSAKNSSLSTENSGLTQLAKQTLSENSILLASTSELKTNCDKLQSSLREKDLLIAKLKEPKETSATITQNEMAKKYKQRNAVQKTTIETLTRELSKCKSKT